LEVVLFLQIPKGLLCLVHDYAGRIHLHQIDQIGSVFTSLNYFKKLKINSQELASSFNLKITGCCHYNRGYFLFKLACGRGCGYGGNKQINSETYSQFPFYSLHQLVMDEVGIFSAGLDLLW
jgi:hypothetical protein